MNHLIDALDLPSELRPIQEAYWHRKNEWFDLQAAYQRVVVDLLRGEHPLASPHEVVVNVTAEGVYTMRPGDEVPVLRYMPLGTAVPE